MLEKGFYLEGLNMSRILDTIIGKNKNDYYSLKRIKETNSVYNVIIGERSNGKTYSVLLEGLKQFFENGSELGIIRRWKEDIIGSRASGIFRTINENNEVSKLSGGEYTGVTY